MAPSWVIPVASLSAIVVAMTIFIWLWFPHAYKKGVKSDLEELNTIDGPSREAQRQRNRDIIERYTRRIAIERGEIVEDEERQKTPPPVYSPPAELPQAYHEPQR